MADEPLGKATDRRENVKMLGLTPFTSRMSKALFYERRMKKHEEKIAEAKKLIASARLKIAHLQRSAGDKP